MTDLQKLLVVIPFAPLVGAALAGLLGTKFLGNVFGRRVSHTVTILGVAVSFALSLYVFVKGIYGADVNFTLYTWLVADGVKFQIGFLVDALTVMMMLVVTFVSLMVHIYTIGYMHEDEAFSLTSPFSPLPC